MTQGENKWRYKPAGTLAWWAIGLMGVRELCMLITVGIELVAIAMFPDTWQNEDAVASGSQVAMALLMLLFVVGGAAVYIATAVVFCCWQYRTAVNARALGAQYMRVSPGANAGWWFVPFANLIMPCKAMVENYKASDPEGDPTKWRRMPTPSIVGLWWTVWLIGNVLGQTSMRIALVGDEGSQDTARMLDMWSLLLSLIAMGLIVTIMLRITRWQTTRAQTRDATLPSGAQTPDAAAATP